MMRHRSVGDSFSVVDKVTEISPCLAAKGAFISQSGLAGFAMWEAGGDSNNILLNAISTALGCGDC